MREIDRITEDGKKAIVGILNEGLAVEYIHLVNYPRIIDQLLNMGKVPDDDPCVVVLERLGKDSIEHANIVMRLCTHLGGEPHLAVEPVERISDVWEICQSQMEKEKENLLLFQRAKVIAQKNQVTKLRGVLDENIRMIRDIPNDIVKRSSVIKLLTALANDEMRHIKLLGTVISDLTQHRNKSDN